MDPNELTCEEFVRWKSAATRRALLARGLGTGLALLGSSGSFSQAVFRGPKEEGNVLVVLFLRGGADGLNMVAPYEEDTYYRSRPTLALRSPKDKRSGTTDRLLDLNGFFGFHPALSSLFPLYAEGKVAVIHATGSGDETRSHFEAMGTMERGQHTGTLHSSNGWLARHLMLTPDRSTPMRAVAIGSTLPDSLSGATSPLSCQSITDYRLDHNDRATLQELTRLYQGDDEVSVAGRKTLEVLRVLHDKNPESYVPEHSAVYADNPVAKAFKQVAYLVKNDFGLEVACLESLGWDTHIAQGGPQGWQANLIKEVSDGIAAFYRDLGPEAPRVTTLVQTEFGRRIEENSGFGTDHGHGGAMFVVGGNVKGGHVYGDWPGIGPGQVTGPGDLQVTTDYRTVLAEILDARLDCPSLERVFPGWKPEKLGLFS